VWCPDPATSENLDHLYVTPLGMLDVPPTLMGRYEEFRAAACTVDRVGVATLVCMPVS
jgi:hypothetical protein